MNTLSLNTEVRIARVLGLALFFGAVTVAHADNHLTTPRHTPMVEMSGTGEEPVHVQLLQADESQYLIYDPLLGEERLIPRSSGLHFSMHLDIDIRTLVDDVPGSDTIELQSGEKLQVMVLDLNENWVSYTLPGSGRRQVARQAELWQVSLDNDSIRIPYPAITGIASL